MIVVMMMIPVVVVVVVNVVVVVVVVVSLQIFRQTNKMEQFEHCKRTLLALVVAGKIVQFEKNDAICSRKFSYASNQFFSQQKSYIDR